MDDDPHVSEVGPEGVLVRRGINWESATRLAAQAARAEQGGTATNGIAYGHGVSVTTQDANQQLSRDPTDAVQALRRVLEEAGFTIRFTPTRSDASHHTIQLPKPVTDEIADRFNRVFGRTPPEGVT
jgi:hypothetical protein